MGASENRTKSQKTAEFMKAKGVRRTTGQCPWGCGAGYSLDRPNALVEHLNKCEGGGKKRFRTGTQPNRKRRK